MRLVLDTNTVISGLLWSGPPGRIIDAAQLQQIELVSSTAMLAELEDVLSRPKFAEQLAKRGLHAIDLFDGYAALVAHITPQTTLSRRTSRDPDDDKVLACAISGNADLIVSGDNDLLALKSFSNILIVTAVEALGMINART